MLWQGLNVTIRKIGFAKRQVNKSTNLNELCRDIQHLSIHRLYFPESIISYWILYELIKDLVAYFAPNLWLSRKKVKSYGPMEIVHSWTFLKANTTVFVLHYYNMSFSENIYAGEVWWTRTVL